MAYKIDITIIIRDHLKTLVNDKTQKPDGRDYAVFGLFPIIGPALLIYNHIFISEAFINALLSGLSIYVGLSLNLIMLLFETLQKNENSIIKKEVAKELVANVSFSILLSLTTIGSCLFTLIKDCIWATYISNYISYFLIIQMVLIILMLIKRMYYQLLDQTT